MQKDSRQRPTDLQTVERAIHVLHCFTRKDQWTLSELAKELDVHKTVMYRLLSTLERHGFVARDRETKRYRLGFALMELGSLAQASLEVRQVALPSLRHLLNATQETAFLTVLAGDEAVCAECLESPLPFKMAYWPGYRHPLHAGAPGKVILAFLPEEQRASVLERLELVRYTDQTPTDRKSLEEELAEIRRQGYALTEGELNVGATGIAAPVYDHSGRLVAGIGLVGPSKRFRERLEEIIPLILDAAREVSTKLGYRSAAPGMPGGDRPGAPDPPRASQRAVPAPLEPR